MSKKVILVLVAFAIWSVVSWQWYTCGVKGFCGGDAVAAPANNSMTSPAAEAQNPLLFSWSNSEPITSSRFSALRDSLSNVVGANEALTITGYYTEAEENTSDFANLGLARAQQVKELLANQMDTSQITTTSEVLASDVSMQNAPFEGVEFSVNPVIPEGAEIVELDDRTIIYFPFGSSNPELSETINQYLTQLAERLEGSDQTVVITGHTDDVGDEQPNQELGLKRANIVKDILAKRGISAERITANSAGETQPIATNDTEVGRKKNRRIELMVNN
ncbi:OmpA family protein [Tunicatimonas pelagia]|uniref:OmpA family protein n=1 Tax=Tunicatimonas pelagia TaxID=931531 RepID=UPI0026658DF7|nr:OmpA family protein [Tunicatimonas pelagia]WKN43894.1 OmpA family protein [Tunicatimonas pelagia]